MALKEITLANFYAWLSENRYFGVEKGQFQYAKNVDMQAEPRGMRLIAEQLVDIASFNGSTGDCTLLQRLDDWFPNATGWIHFNWGSMYKDGSFISGVPSTGIKGWQKVVVAGNNYVYLFGNNAIDLYNVSANTYTSAIASFSSPSSVTYRPSVSIASAVLVGAGDAVYQVSGIPASVVITKVITIAIAEDITAITRFSSEFKIYTKVGIEWGGKQYSWDGASNATSAFFSWDNCAPIHAISAGSFDYVLAGKNEEFTDLYIASGNERRLVRSGAVGGKGRRFFPRMRMCKDILYIMGSIDISAKGESVNRESCIFSYWSENAGFPNGMQIETILPVVATEEPAYNNLYPTEDFLYFVQGTTGVVANKQYKIQKRRNISTNYIASGSWISNTITGGVIWTRKDFKMLAIGYSLDATLGYGGSINVYIRNKTYGAFTLVKSITDATFNYCKIFENELSGDINVFHEMEVKIELIGSTAFSPIIYEATLIYDDNLRA